MKNQLLKRLLHFTAAMMLCAVVVIGETGPTTGTIEDTGIGTETENDENEGSENGENSDDSSLITPLDDGPHDRKNLG